MIGKMLFLEVQLMTISRLRKQVQQQIESLPEDVLQEVADFMTFLLDRRRHEGEMTSWDEDAWQQMALEQLFREEEDVEYTIEDAVEN